MKIRLPATSIETPAINNPRLSPAVPGSGKAGSVAWAEGEAGARVGVGVGVGVKVGVGLIAASSAGVGVGVGVGVPVADGVASKAGTELSP